MFKQYELKYIRKMSDDNVSVGGHFNLKRENELNIVIIEDEISFIYFGDSKIYEFNQIVESA